MAHLLGHFDAGSDEWHEQRRNRIGGSEAAVCVGLSPFESWYSLWHRKAGLVPDKQVDSPAMEWGRRLEAEILHKWCDNHGDYGPRQNGTWQSEQRPHMVANPDALVAKPGGATEIVEIKTASQGWQWGEHGATGSDAIPVHYRCQVLHYMAVLGATIAHVAVLIAGNDYREYTIERDDEAEQDIAQIVAAEQQFMDSLPGGRAEQTPNIDDHTATFQMVREMHPDIEQGEAVEIPAALKYDYKTACATAKNAQDQKRKTTAQILDQMGNAQYAEHEGQRVASRQAKPGGTPYLVAARTK